MDIHEYQAKALLANYGVRIAPYRVIERLEQLQEAYEELKAEKVVLKVQVHAGGRGKAGGIQLVSSLEEAQSTAHHLLGMRILNRQTGREGMRANQLLMTPAVDILQEYYLAIVVDRSSAALCLIGSPKGGMDIEEVADASPEQLLKLTLPPGGKVRSYQLLHLCKFMGWDSSLHSQAKVLVEGLAKAFWESDSSLIEINPLVVTPGGELLALDAKVTLDDNGLWRHLDLQGFFDPTQLPKTEARAREIDLAYIALEGDIGCMVNGAGLAMATMDIIKYSGGAPANFLDVGGSASREKIAEGFRLLLSDPHVKVILVNIFGGIMNCATLAQGILDAAIEKPLAIPMVVRMEGTEVEQARQLLSDSSLPLIIADTLADAAQKAVQAAKRQGA